MRILRLSTCRQPLSPQLPFLSLSLVADAYRSSLCHPPGLLLDSAIQNESNERTGAYSMLSQEENELLTRVGPETPAGKLLRRYWHVVSAASELSDEKTKKRVRILGEDLVLFRNQSGNYGLVGEHCSHRGASLYYGFVEVDGIRCPYHGWQ